MIDLLPHSLEDNRFEPTYIKTYKLDEGPIAVFRFLYRSRGNAAPFLETTTPVLI